MKIYNYPSEAAAKRLERIVRRGLTIRQKDEVAVKRILKDVQRNGDESLIKYSRKFDAPNLSSDQLGLSESLEGPARIAPRGRQPGGPDAVARLAQRIRRLAPLRRSPLRRHGRPVASRLPGTHRPEPAAP